TEQILCSHPEVHGAGELFAIFRLFLDLKEKIKPDLGMPRCASKLTPELTQGMAESYLGTIHELNAVSRYVSDKMPFNFRYLGLIALLFPHAKIVHTTRHPLDTGLSCYFARFHQDLDFSFNLSDIGRYTRDYRRLMDHWARVVPNDVLV